MNLALEVPTEGEKDIIFKDVNIGIEQLMEDTGKLQLAYVNGQERRDVMLFNIKASVLIASIYQVNPSVLTQRQTLG